MSTTSISIEAEAKKFIVAIETRLQNSRNSAAACEVDSKARIADLEAIIAKAKSEEAVAKLHGIFDRHLSKLPAKEQARRWTALEQKIVADVKAKL